MTYRPPIYVDIPDSLEYDSYKSPCFSTRKLDEGPVLNRIGCLCKFLYYLGLQSPKEVFMGNVTKPKFHKRMRKHLHL